jgi:glucose/mannose-6-phosphate isomerase
MIHSYELSKSFNSQYTGTKFGNVLLSGLGGSGIGSSIVSELFKFECNIPILVSKSYFPPSFINENTLFIATSYSGDTEETISSIKFAQKRNCKIVIITSGGYLLQFARENNFDYVLIPGGMPPRAALAYSLFQIINIFIVLNLVSSELINDWLAAADYIENKKTEIQEYAREIAAKIYNKFPIVYAESELESVITRFRQQINENSKHLLHSNIVPEMNHNEIVGWKDISHDFVVLLVRTNFDFDRNIQRINFVEKVVNSCQVEVINISSNLNSKILNYIYLIHLFDYVSVYLSDLKGVDTNEIEVINSLKEELGRTPINIREDFYLYNILKN